MGTRTALLAPLADVGPDRRRRGARRRLQERPHAALPGPRRGARAGAARRRRGRAGLARRPSVESDGPRPMPAATGAPSSPSAPRGTEPRVTRGRPPRGARGRQPRPALRRARRRPRRARHRGAASGRSSSSTGGGRRRSCCAATAARSRPARTATGRWSTTRPGPRSAATTAAAPGRSRRAARRARSPRIRYLGGGTERVEREVRERFPRPARRPPGPRRRRAQGRRRPRARRVRGGAARRPRRDQPRGQGPRRARGHAGRHRVRRHRAQPARRARLGADVPAARAGGRPGRDGATAPGVAYHPDLPARAPGDPRGRRGRRHDASTTRSSPCASGSGRRRSGAWSSSRSACPDRDAAEREATAMADRLRGRAVGASSAGPGRRARAGLRRPPRRTAGGSTWSSGARTPSRCSIPLPGSPWSDRRRPESRCCNGAAPGSTPNRSVARIESVPTMSTTTMPRHDAAPQDKEAPR